MSADKARKLILKGELPRNVTVDGNLNVGHNALETDCKGCGRGDFLFVCGDTFYGRFDGCGFHSFEFVQMAAENFGKPLDVAEEATRVIKKVGQDGHCDGLSKALKALESK